jgi:hypothetical protein
MATCPRCLGPLTENHRCPHGIFKRVTDVISTVAIGGVAGAVITFLIEDRPAGAVVLAFAALGAVLATAIRRAVGPRF